MKKNSVAFWVTSILFGIAVGALYGYAYAVSWTDQIFIGLSTGIIFGLALTVIAFLTHRVLMSLAGLLLGGLIASGIYMLPHGRWQPFPPPPEPVAEIITDLPFDVWGDVTFIRTQDGSVYSYDCSSSSACGWVEVTTLPDTPPVWSFPCENDRLASFPTPLPPGRVTQSYKFNICGADYSVQVHYLLLDDGSLWGWSRGSSPYEIMGFFVPVIGTGFVVGLIGSCLPFVTHWQKNKAKMITARA